jgi:predicted nucleic acid-binding protein
MLPSTSKMSLASLKGPPRGQHRPAIPDLIISAAARAAGLTVLH